MRILPFAAATLLGLALLLHPGARDGPIVVPPREREASIVIRGRDGGKPRVAIAGFAALEDDEEADPALVVAGTLRSDLAFEAAFELLPPGPSDPSLPSRDGDPALQAWAAARVDGVLVGRVVREGDDLIADLRLYEPSSGQLAFARGARGPAAEPRAITHLLAHELLASQAGLDSVALTRLAFVSDRAGSRRDLTGYLRRVKEIYVADYDGANQRRVTADGDLVLTPSWSPDGTSIAYTAFRAGFQQVLIARPSERAGAVAALRGKNWLPAWSPDGEWIACTSNRDGNEEIYVVRPDGSDARRLTRSWAIDTSPAWSPDGSRIAFTSSRTGSPQIWTMNADGSDQRQLTHERYCDRPTWSAAPYGEIAYVSRTRTGFDIKVIDPETGTDRQLTFGHGFNESPAWAPSGRHLAFTSTRGGSQQIWTMTREGEDLRQVTRAGANSMPAWAPRPR